MIVGTKLLFGIEDLQAFVLTTSSVGTEETWIRFQTPRSKKADSPF